LLGYTAIHPESRMMHSLELFRGSNCAADECTNLCDRPVKLPLAQGLGGFRSLKTSVGSALPRIMPLRDQLRVGHNDVQLDATPQDCLPRHFRAGRRRTSGTFRLVDSLLFLVLATLCTAGVDGFGIGSPGRAMTTGGRRNHQLVQRRLAEDNIADEGEELEDDTIGDDDDTGSVDLDDLNWRVAKQRLEEQNTKRFLKSGPRFLPYDECRKWVQAWGSRWESETEWRDWIYMGEKRNSYIPVSDFSCCVLIHVLCD
jgi:hypothetical protein